MNGMPALTSDDLFQLAAQLSAMAKSVEAQRLRNPRHSAEDKSLQAVRDRLLNASSDLAASSINVALNQLSPHYDAMLSVLRGLKAELAQEEKLSRIFAFADAALAIAAAFASGDIAGVLGAIAGAKKLLTPAVSS